MKKITILPNLVTTANVFCGFLAVIKITRSLTEDNPEFLLHGAWYIFLAMIFDALDGKVARMMKAPSDFGAQLDSLCDAISFGLAPAYLVYVIQVHFSSIIFGGSIYKEKFLFMSSAIFICCAVLRLARFNVEANVDDDHRYFKGIPTPAAAGILSSLIILFFNDEAAAFFKQEQLQKWVLYALPWYTIGCSLLMVSSVKFMHVVSVVSASRVRFEILAAFVIFVVLIYVNPDLSVVACFHFYLLSGIVTSTFSKFLKESINETEET